MWGHISKSLGEWTTSCGIDLVSAGLDGVDCETVAVVGICFFWGLLSGFLSAMKKKGRAEGGKHRTIAKSEKQNAQPNGKQREHEAASIREQPAKHHVAETRAAPDSLVPTPSDPLDELASTAAVTAFRLLEQQLVMPAEAAGWIHHSDTRGVRIYTRKGCGGRTDGMGTGELGIPCAAIYAAHEDPSRRHLLDKQFASSTLLHECDPASVTFDGWVVHQLQLVHQVRDMRGLWSSQPPFLKLVCSPVSST